MINATTLGFGGGDSKDRTRFMNALQEMSRLSLPERKKKTVKREKGKEFQDIIGFIGG